MGLNRPLLVVAFELSERRKAIVADDLAGAAHVVYLTELTAQLGARHWRARHQPPPRS
jgi:hypothetical protein